MEDFDEEELEELGETEETEASYDVVATFSAPGVDLEGVEVILAHFGPHQDRQAIECACTMTKADVLKKMKILPPRTTTITFNVDEIVEISNGYSEDIGTIFKIDLAV